MTNLTNGVVSYNLVSMTDLTKLVTYDLECYPNYFSAVCKDRYLNKTIKFELSWRYNHIGSLMQWLGYWQNNGYTMVGFNNNGYDYPLLHQIMTRGLNTTGLVYAASDSIISTPWEKRFSVIIPDYKKIIPQIDLMKVHHFDNDAKRTGLKKIEFTMRSGNIKDLPYPAGQPLVQTDEVGDTMLSYNEHDVNETDKFLNESMKALEFRKSLSEKYGKNFMNHNDTKVGKDFFIMQLESKGVKCYRNGQPIQTFRRSIALRDCIFDYIKFDTTEFNNLLSELKSEVITETKGALAKSVVLNGFSFDFALGGIHGSVKSKTFESCEKYVVRDADVASYYPNLAIKNKIFPEHLGMEFCDTYSDIYEQRAHWKKINKGGIEDACLKLALNGVYGDSNSMYSVFYDSKYTMTTTINGQLLLCMLAESLLLKIPELQMIQINTDGLTVKYPRAYDELYNSICTDWERLTQLELEYIDYKKMMVRDVNNYIAIPEKGKPKFKGAYVHTGAHLPKGELEWHKNHSALITKIAAAKALVDGVPISTTIRNHPDIFDFFLLTNVDRKTKVLLKHSVEWEGRVVFEDTEVEEHQRNTRYLVTKNGGKLVKVMPKRKRTTPNVNMVYPNWQGKKRSGCNKNRKVTSLIEYQMALDEGYVTKDGGTYNMTSDNVSELESGFKCSVFNEVLTNNAKHYDIDYNYYIKKAEDLVDGILG